MLCASVQRMPSAPKHQCPYPGCTALVERGRCERHAGVRQRRHGYAADARFYHSARWRRVRDAKLRNDPLCQYCLAKDGRPRPATTVDHRTALAEGGHPTDAANLVSSCTPCHSSKTRAEQLGQPLPPYAPSRERELSIA